MQEIDLLDVLSAEFPNDRFERTSKGQRGADVRQTVMGPGGAAGVILWEAKRTKLWSDTWLPKLREDQRAAKADVAVIATETLPAGVAHFECVDGVWVTGFPFIVPLAEAMRQRLVEAARARRAAAGADQKKDLTYDYVTGNEFRSRVAGLLEPIVAMRDSLDLEKRTADKQFAARGKQIERLGMNLAGMYGDFQGIVGSSLPIVVGLALPEPDSEESAEAPQLTAGNGRRRRRRGALTMMPPRHRRGCLDRLSLPQEGRAGGGRGHRSRPAQGHGRCRGGVWFGNHHPAQRWRQVPALPAAGRGPAVPVARIAAPGRGRRVRASAVSPPRACTPSDRTVGGCCRSISPGG